VKRMRNRASQAILAWVVTVGMAVTFWSPKTLAYNPHNLPNGTQVIGWTTDSTGITVFYSGNITGNYPATLPNASYPLDDVLALSTYAEQNPGGAASIFPTGIGLSVSPNAEAVMTVFTFNPDQIGGQDIPPLTSLTASQESFLETAGYGSQLQAWEAEHSAASSSSTPPPSSSAPPTSSAPPPSSPPPSAPPSSSSPPPAVHTTAPSSPSTAPGPTATASGTPSSTKPPTPVLPPVKPSLVKHPVKRAHPGVMPKNQRPVALARPAHRDPPAGSPAWPWWGGGGVVLLGGVGVLLKVRHLL